MNPPKISRKQHEILGFLYSYRFLNRIQIQKFLNHKDPKRINLWLRDLRQQGYVERIYSTNFVERTKPAIYYLSLNGIRYFKTLPDYSVEEIRKRYRESTRSESYRDHCIVLADCCLTMLRQLNKNLSYSFEVEADYLQKNSPYHFFLESELIHPHLCFEKQHVAQNDGDEPVSYYFLLEIFDPGLPRYRIVKRLKDYLKYLDDYEYEWQRETDSDELPCVYIVCAMLSDLIYAKRRMRGLLSERDWDYEEVERPTFRFTSFEDLKVKGLLTHTIWETA